jgi:hypothetical protein
VTPVDMALKHDPANGVWGDCMRSCVASILDLPREAVPHFYEGGCEPHIFDQRVGEFLAQHGLIEVTLLPAYARQQMRHTPCYHLIYGGTVRGTYHAVVGLNGVVVHDPHPSRAGIIENGQTQYALLVRTGAQP